MAETTETADIGVSDSDLFSGAVAPTAAPEPATEAPPPHPALEDRDALGRFRARQEAQQQQPTDPAPATPPAPPPVQPAPVPGQPTPPQQDDSATVPSWRLREEREQRERLAQQLQERDYALRDMQRRMAQFEQQQAPQQQPDIPDPLIDPQGYRTALEGKFQSDLRTVQLENNLQLNRLQHGEVFDQAYQAFMQAAQSDQGFARLIVNSPNPGGAMVNWYRRAVTLARVGDDPEAFINTEIERRLSDPKFLATALERARAVAGGQPQAGAAPRPNNVTQIPPSLSRVPSGSPTETFSGADGISDEELFRGSLPPPRRKA
jgi:hypothetical protein